VGPNREIPILSNSALGVTQISLLFGIQQSTMVYWAKTNFVRNTAKVNCTWEGVCNTFAPSLPSGRKITGQSQWPRGPRHEASSRHGCLRALILCTGSGLVTGWSPSTESYRLCTRLRNWKTGQGPTKGSRERQLIVHPCSIDKNRLLLSYTDLVNNQAASIGGKWLPTLTSNLLGVCGLSLPAERIETGIAINSSLSVN
jgi:hypothetical protein